MAASSGALAGVPTGLKGSAGGVTGYMVAGEWGSSAHLFADPPVDPGTEPATDPASDPAPDPAETPAATEPAESQDEPAATPDDSGADSDETTKAADADVPNPKAEGPVEASAADATETASKPAATAVMPELPEFELTIYSVEALADAVRSSKTAAIYAALSRLVPSFESESDEQFDLPSLMKLFGEIGSWPDTPVMVQVYRQDASGHPRWTLQVNWTHAALSQRLKALLVNDAAAKVIGDVTFHDDADGVTRIDLSDIPLAVIHEIDGHAVMSSPQEVPLAYVAVTSAADVDGKGPLLTSRLLLAEQGDSEGSLFSGLAGVRDITFALSMDDGRWVEEWKLGWNPFVGMALKSLISRVSKPFVSSNDAFITAAFGVTGGEAIFEGMTGLADSGVAAQVKDQMCVIVAPGTGFLPVPDVFVQSKCRSAEEVLSGIHDAAGRANGRSKERGENGTWTRSTIGKRVIYMNDPGLNSSGVPPMIQRTVLFVDKESDGSGGMVVICFTSNRPEDICRTWDKMSRAPKKEQLSVPSTKRAHWQVVLNWSNVYELAQPWLGVASGFIEGAEMPPLPEEMADVLSPSVIDLRVEFAGLKVKHVGPVPLGAAYTPIAMAIALQKDMDFGSEAAREETAVEHLRVLHHHAMLFKKDHDRWPARVAELDGYIDFRSNRYLLQLRPMKTGLLAGLESLRERHQRDAEKSNEEEIEGLDDSLYAVHWSKSDAGYRIALRDGQFKNLRTIAIDGEGEIHRVPEGEAVVAEPASPEASPETMQMQVIQPMPSEGGADQGKQKDESDAPELTGSAAD